MLIASRIIEKLMTMKFSHVKESRFHFIPIENFCMNAITMPNDKYALILWRIQSKVIMANKRSILIISFVFASCALKLVTQSEERHRLGCTISFRVIFFLLHFPCCFCVGISREKKNHNNNNSSTFEWLIRNDNLY